MENQLKRIIEEKGIKDPLVFNKIYELCKITKEYPITKDGCGVPIMSIPLENMLYGYLNVFCNPKYLGLLYPHLLQYQIYNYNLL